MCQTNDVIYPIFVYSVHYIRQGRENRALINVQHYNYMVRDSSWGSIWDCEHVSDARFMASESYPSDFTRTEAIPYLEL